MKSPRTVSCDPLRIVMLMRSLLPCGCYPICGRSNLSVLSNLRVRSLPQTITWHARMMFYLLYRRQSKRPPLHDNDWFKICSYLIVTARNCSCPAVSQICTLTLRVSGSRMVFEVNYTPIVGFAANGFLPLSYTYIMFVLPTPASPTTITALLYWYLYRSYQRLRFLRSLSYRLSL